MANYIFEKFEEVEDSIRQVAPKVVYKYRGDWNNPYHRELITKQALWFAAPRELNDPYDIRTPVQFDVAEIDDPDFLLKMMEGYKMMNPRIAFTERELRVICQNKLDYEIKKDPLAYFRKNYKEIRDGELFDRVGLFSCSADPENEAMWAYYGNNSRGFVVGFNTVNMARDLICTIGPVRYDDNVPFHSFLKNKQDDEVDLLFLKSKRWESEKEFRFITIEDDAKFNRVKHYSIDTVHEFLLGSSFPKDQRAEFVSEVRKIFPAHIPIYQLHLKATEFGYDRELL